MQPVRRPPRRMSHSSLIPIAADLAAALRRENLLPYPGVIAPRGGGGSVARVVVAVEANRIRLAVSAAGHQDLLLYGMIEQERVMAAVASVFPPGAIVVRDPNQLWAAPEPSAPRGP